jgi:hypothetical protein
MIKNRVTLTRDILSISIKLGLFFSVFLFFLFLTKIFDAQAETLTTSVTVGNAAPTFTVNPFEDPASSTTSPTNVGSNVTWRATGTDANNDNYYLIVCSTNSVTPGSAAAPTCGGTTWCTSTSTASASQASCNRTTLAGDSHSNAWFAFVCDHLSTGAACSSTHQGSGDSGSPFVVNHAPNFTAVSNNSPQNPGGTITWSTTASDPNGYDVKLLVCKTAGITGGACTGDSWCTSNFAASNPSCNYEIPSVAPAATNNAYVYIIDEFNFPATSAQQGSNVGFTINNVAPVVSAVTINGGVAINLEAETTKAVTLTATVSDNNSCEDIDTVEAYVYRSGIGYSGCDTSGEANNNYCYPEVSCSVVGGTCTGPTDASANYTCTVNLQYYADPTDTNTQYPTQTWLNTIKATDNAAVSGNTEVSTGVNVNSLNAFSITGSINFGSLGVDQSNDPLDKIVTTTPTGNIGLDQEHSGAANMCVDFPTCSGGTPIGVANQKYSLTTSTAYASGTVLSTSPTLVSINVPKPTSGTPATRNTWWGILIPTGTLAGAYSGENTVTSVKSNPSNW